MVEENSQPQADSKCNKFPRGETVNKQRSWNRLGVGLSFVSAIHCLLVPIFISLNPLWSALEDVHEFTHLVFFLAITPMVILSLILLDANKFVTFFGL